MWGRQFNSRPEAPNRKIDMPFLTGLDVKEASNDNWELLEPLVYQGNTDLFTVPTGFFTDLASIPRVFRPFFPRYGIYRKAAVLHDYHYIVQLVSRKDADGMFRRVMRELGVGRIRRYLMWLAVRIGGSYRKNIDLSKHGL